jgi:hypothetical protein
METYLWICCIFNGIENSEFSIFWNFQLDWITFFNANTQNTKRSVDSRDEQSGPGPRTKFFFWPGSGPGPNFFSLGPAPKFFLNGTRTKMFFLDRDRNKNIFDWNPHLKFVSDGTGTKTLNFFSPGPRPGPKFFCHRDRDLDQNFFLAGTGTKNDWSRSCLVDSDYVNWLQGIVFSISDFRVSIRQTSN